MFSLQLLQPLLEGSTYAPFTAWSLSPHALATVCNDVVINRRSSIIEFGTGFSTILLGRLIRQNGLECRLLAAEEDASWSEAMHEAIQREQLDDKVDIIYAPLGKSTRSLDNLEWYDEAALDHAVASRAPFDLVLVDGPSAGESLKRYPAIPYLRQHLAESSSVYLDDMDRSAERRIAKMWSDQLETRFRLLTPRLGAAFAGEHLSPAL